jgi:rhodanese-related sulfurtransferase
MKKIIALMVIFLVAMFSYALAESFKNIAADELKAMLDKKTNLVLIDARSGLEYNQGHIPLAVNIPPEKVGLISSFLPKSKKILIVFYCRGVG